jgi:hypothetical protein
MDTMELSVVSKRGNQYAQVFATPFGWTRVYTMKKKSDAHDGLSLMFAQDGVPTCRIMDNSKEQTLGKFGRRLGKATVG